MHLLASGDGLTATTNAPRSVGIARVRYTAKHEHWTLYRSDRDQRWHMYDLIAPSADVLALLDELDRDPTCIFWG